MKKLYAQLGLYECGLRWLSQPEEGWYEIEREPDFREGEYLEYDEKNDCIVIKKQEKTTEQIEAERQAKTRSQLREELPDLILQNKDNPTALAQALCDRAKQIEAEIREVPGVMEKL